MSTQQKSALYQLIFGLLAAAAYVLLRSLVSPAVAPAALSLLAPTGLVPILFRHEVTDERELFLARKALIVGFTASYLFVVALCMSVWALRFLGGEATVSIDLLPLIAGGTFAVHLIVRAATVLLLAPRPMDIAG